MFCRGNERKYRHSPAESLLDFNTQSSSNTYNSQYNFGQYFTEKKYIYLHPQYSIHFKLNNGKFLKYNLKSHIDVFKQLSHVSKRNMFLYQSSEYVMYSKQLFGNNSTFQILGSGIFSILHFKYLLFICS